MGFSNIASKLMRIFGCCLIAAGLLPGNSVRAADSQPEKSLAFPTAQTTAPVNTLNWQNGLDAPGFRFPFLETNPQVMSIVFDNNGSLFAAGNFSEISRAANVAR